jgi:nucleoside-diphosphate-sugar epimerase
LGHILRILVTGGAGYIGSVLVPKLLEKHEVTVLDNFIYRQNSLAQLCKQKNFDVYKVDCRDSLSVKPFLRRADVIIPLAALVGVPLCNLNPIDAALLNLHAPLEMFKNLSQEQLVIMPTTESSYGSNADVCTEETPANPLSTYAEHKLEVENALLQRDKSISLRLATVFGMSPRMRLDLLINDFVWRAQKDRAFVLFEARYRRTCVHVTDVARAFLHALEKNLRGIYNVGAVTLTKQSLCEAINNHSKFTFIEADFDKDPDQRDYIVSDDKIRKTGFQPMVDLDTGIKELLKGFRMLSNSVHGNV